MSDQNRRDVERDRDAALAQQLLDNPLLMAILAELDTDAVRTWRVGSNPEQREQAWHQMGAIQQLAHRIKGRIDTKLLAAGSRKRS
jgi:hypothetical protein